MEFVVALGNSINLVIQERAVKDEINSAQIQGVT